MKTARLVILSVSAALALTAAIPASASFAEGGASASGTENYTLQLAGGAVSISGPDGTENAADIDPSSLRDADRRMLAAGITVESHDELLGLLEDFSS